MAFGKKPCFCHKMYVNFLIKLNWLVEISNESVFQALQLLFTWIFSTYSTISFISLFYCNHFLLVFILFYIISIIILQKNDLILFYIIFFHYFFIENCSVFFLLNWLFAFFSYLFFLIYVYICGTWSFVSIRSNRLHSIRISIESEPMTSIDSCSWSVCQDKMSFSLSQYFDFVFLANLLPIARWDRIAVNYITICTDLL